MCFIIVFFIPLLGFASQVAVTVKATRAYEQPDLNSKILQEIPESSSVRASNLPNFGFHRVRLASGVVGYVPADALRLSFSEISQSPPAVASGFVPAEVPVRLSSQSLESQVATSQAPVLEQLPVQGAMPVQEAMPEKRTMLEGSPEFEQNRSTARSKQHTEWKFFGNMLMSNFDSLFLSATSIQNIYGLGGEGLLFLSSSFLVGLRYDQLNNLFRLQDSADSRLYQVSFKLRSFLLGASCSFSLASKVYLQFGGFFGLANQSIESIDSQSPSAVGGTFLASTSTFSGLGKMELHWYFFQFFSTFLEIGYRYVPAFQVHPGSVTGFATRIFQSNFALNYSASFGGVGVAFRF